MKPGLHAALPIAWSPSRGQRLLGLGVIAGVVLVQLLSQYVANRDSLRLVSIVLFLLLEMPALLAALSAFYGWALRRGVRILSTVLMGVALSAGIGAIAGALFFCLSLRFPDLGLHLSTRQPLSWVRASIFGLTYGIGHFGLWTLAIALPVALDDARLRALEATQLRTSAELARLRSNLEPHFLLNTLNAIAGLTTEDPRTARRLLVCLGDLLREVFHESRSEDDLQPLGAQVAWLKRYAEILEIRHRGALRFEWELDSHSVDDLLPRLLLQPLVENAVKHGALKRSGGGRVTVRTARSSDGSQLVCTVADDGPGMRGEPRAGAFGLESVRRRLELRYPGRASLTLDASAEGTRATVRLPRAVAQ